MRAAFVEYERISGLEASASVEAAMEDDDDVNVEYWNTILSFGESCHDNTCIE